MNFMNFEPNVKNRNFVTYCRSCADLVYFDETEVLHKFFQPSKAGIVGSSIDPPIDMNYILCNIQDNDYKQHKLFIGPKSQPYFDDCLRLYCTFCGGKQCPCIRTL